MKRVLVIVGSLCALLGAYSFNNSTCPVLYFLNVGQGDSELVRGCYGVFLIDAGSGEEVVAELESVLGQRKRIDIVFLSHAERDHAGGLLALMDRYELGAVALPLFKTDLSVTLKAELARRSIPVVYFFAGSQVTQGALSFRALWPFAREVNKEANDNSLVLKYTDGFLKALFAGDISSHAEKKIVKMMGSDVRADILKVPHHGSRFSSSDPFLQAVIPRVAFIEVGKNSYGHPSSEVIDRIMRGGARVLRTDASGTLEVLYEQGGLSIRSLNGE